MDVARYIRASGKPTGQTDARRRQICEVLCQGCGERISSADAEGVEYVKTKRGTELFFHTRCAGAVWGHGIV